MMFSNSPIFSFLRLISIRTSYNMPYVNVQPRMFIPSCRAPYHPDSLVGNENMTLAHTVPSGRNRLLALEFSISYDDYPECNLYEHTYRFKLDKVEVFIEKFRKRLDHSTNFNGIFHIPQIIYLPAMSNKLVGFELFVSPFVTANNHGDLRKKCQIISLFYDQDPHMKRDVYSLKHAIFCFRKLMGIQMNENPEGWGFRFSIRIKEKLKTNLSYPLPFITTNMFGLIFSQNNLEVKLQPVDKRLYYTYD